jgi:hypothetical protein
MLYRFVVEVARNMLGALKFAMLLALMAAMIVGLVALCVLTYATYQAHAWLILSLGVFTVVFYAGLCLTLLDRIIKKLG